MREYGTIQTAFWAHPGVRRLSDHGRLLYLFLMTGPHTNMSGCFRAPLGYIADDLGWAPETVSEGFAELLREGFAYHDETHRFVFVKDFLKHNRIANPNMSKAVMVWFRQVPDDCDLKGMLAADIIDYVRHFEDGAKAEVERFVKPFPERYGQSGNREQGTGSREQEESSQPTAFQNSSTGAVSTQRAQGATDASPPDASSRKPARPRAKALDMTAAEAEEFSRFWEIYPVRKKRPNAERAFVSARRAGVALDTILAGAVTYAAERAGQDHKFTSHPATWLNAKSWDDEPLPPSSPSRGGRPGGGWSAVDQAVDGIGWGEEAQ